MIFQTNKPESEKLSKQLNENWSQKIPLTELLSQSTAILRTELGDVIHQSNSMAMSCLLHLTDLLPGVAGGVVLQDVLQIRWSVISPCKYIVIINIIWYNEMFNINITENGLTKYKDLVVNHSSYQSSPCLAEGSGAVSLQLPPASSTSVLDSSVQSSL